MPPERVRDNQWWYNQSPHRVRVDRCMFALLSIGGRECPLIHSECRADGRPTYSFKFLNPSDREFWIEQRGQDVEIEVVECGEQMPEVDEADDATLSEPAHAANFVDASSLHRGSETLFDAYLFVDWSAASRPKRGKDSIWIARGYYAHDGYLLVETLNPRTRQEAESMVCEKLREFAEKNFRVLVGFDFPYGYPAGWHLGVGNAGNNGTWVDLWNLFTQRITDDSNNANSQPCRPQNQDASVTR